MVKLCCVKNCGSKSPDPGGKKRTLFKVPTEGNKKDEWMAKIVPYLRKGKYSRIILYICENHFKEDDIVRDFSEILTNGLVCNIGPRQFLKLKPTSVPCFFECQPNAENKNFANDMESHKTYQNVPVHAVTSSTSAKLHPTPSSPPLCMDEENQHFDNINAPNISDNNLYYTTDEIERIKLIHNYCKSEEQLQENIPVIPNCLPRDNINDDKKTTKNWIKHLIENCPEPLVFKNILNWEMINWNLEDWENVLQNEELPCRCGKNVYTKYPQWETVTTRKICTFKHFVELDKSNSQDWIYFDYKYLKDWMGSSESIRKNVSWEPFGYSEIGSQESTIWIGTKGAHTPCHIDTYGCNLVAQVLGRKLWLLFPPESNLQSTRIPYEESSIFSQLNFFTPTPKRFKDINNCRRVILNPGEVLFVPQGWWHYVENLELSISINTWIPTPQDEEKRLEEAIVKMLMFQFANGLSKEEKKFALIQDSDERVLSQQNLKYNLNVTHFCLKSYQNFLESNKKSNTETASDSVLPDETVDDTLRNFGNFVSVIPVLSCEEFSSFMDSQRRRFDENWSYNMDTRDDNDESGEEVVSKVLSAILKPDVISAIKNNLLNS